MKFVFFGTDDFSVAIIEKLISDFFIPSAIVTMPDKPVGRKQIMTPPAVKDVATHHDIPYFQPENPDEVLEDLQKLEADIFIVASYGKIISKSILDLPKIGAVNVHTSLLPKYRGPSPIQQAILDEEKTTGITIMAMDEKMDHGGIYYQHKVEIAPNETYRSLHSKLAYTGADVLAKVLPDIYKGKLLPKEQDHDASTYTAIIKKDDASIDWNSPVNAIDAKIRAYYDWPIAWTKLEDDKRMKIIKASVSSKHQESYTPGLLKIEGDSIFVECSDGLLEIESLQVEGKKEMTPDQFITGFHRFNNTRLK